MAINTFTFGGVTSSTYGIYVSGEKLFNAPARDAEVIQIPGRDGDYILDKGSFKNIKVTYRVFNQEKNLSDFRTKLANLRSALCSKRGYQRLTDTFHPDEYRMAAFIDSIEVTPVKYNTASEFDITFECKPQRWLTSGETKTTLVSGNDITNPTLFDARPQLQVYGYGDITVGNEGTINIQNVPIGIVQIATQTQKSSNRIITTLDDKVAGNVLDTGDTFDISNVICNVLYRPNPNYFANIVPGSISNETNCTATIIASGQINVVVDSVIFTKGTSQTVNYSFKFNVQSGQIGTAGSTTTVTVSGGVSYDSISDIAVTFGVTGAPYTTSYKTIFIPDIFGYSSLPAANPLYIDFDIGEVYTIVNGTTLPFNSAVQMPAELPTLPSGNTTITFDNTFTKVDIIPRWWRV